MGGKEFFYSAPLCIRRVMSGTRRRAWQIDGLEWADSYVGQVQHVETSARRDARIGVTVGAIFEIKMSFK